ncbi:LOW QUALITY PROTEIN: TRAF-interacting protein with FHA domain-containing protein B [Molossus nigricans]
MARAWLCLVGGGPGSLRWASVSGLREPEGYLCSILPRLPFMKRPLTVLWVSLHHPTQGPAVFATVPQRLQHDTSPLLVGRGLDTHLPLHLPRLSRQHLSLEPYREKGSALLDFNLKALSRRGCVWVNGLTLRFLEQVLLSGVNRVTFAGIQMVVHVERGTSLEALVCCFHVSPSPLIYRPQAEETDEWEIIPEEPPAPRSEQLAPGHLGFLHGPSQTGTAHPSQALEEEQKYSSTGSPQTACSASPAAESTPWLKQDLKYSSYIIRP